MRISVHGTDRGGALLTALILIIIISTLTMAFIPRIAAARRYAKSYKQQVINRIELDNKEVMDKYDLY